MTRAVEDAPKLPDNAEHVRALESIKTMCAHILSDEGRAALTAAIAALDRAAVEANRGEDDCVMSGCPERIGMISHHSATDHYVFSINGEVYALERGEFEGMVLLLYTLNRADAERLAVTKKFSQYTHHQPSAAVTELVAAAVDLVELVEGPGCLRWQASDGFRFKDTKQWALFYVAAKKAALSQGGKP